jgi:hypothetical protein
MSKDTKSNRTATLDQIRRSGLIIIPDYDVLSKEQDDADLFDPSAQDGCHLHPSAACCPTHGRGKQTPDGHWWCYW